MKVESAQTTRAPLRVRSASVMRHSITIGLTMFCQAVRLAQCTESHRSILSVVACLQSEVDGSQRLECESYAAGLMPVMKLLQERRPKSLRRTAGIRTTCTGCCSCNHAPNILPNAVQSEEGVFPPTTEYKPTVVRPPAGSGDAQRMCCVGCRVTWALLQVRLKLKSWLLFITLNMRVHTEPKSPEPI